MESELCHLTELTFSELESYWKASETTTTSSSGEGQLGAAYGCGFSWSQQNPSHSSHHHHRQPHHHQPQSVTTTTNSGSGGRRGTGQSSFSPRGHRRSAEHPIPSPGRESFNQHLLQRTATTHPPSNTARTRWSPGSPASHLHSPPLVVFSSVSSSHQENTGSTLFPDSLDGVKPTWSATHNSALPHGTAAGSTQPLPRPPLVPLSDAEVVERERQRWQRLVQDSWRQQRRQRHQWNPRCLRDGARYRPQEVASQVQVKLKKTTFLLPIININPDLLCGGEDPIGVENSIPGVERTESELGGLTEEGNASPGSDAPVHHTPIAPIYMWQSISFIPGNEEAILANLNQQLCQQYDTFAARQLPSVPLLNQNSSEILYWARQARKEATPDSRVICHYFSRGFPRPPPHKITVCNGPSQTHELSLRKLSDEIGFPLILVADCQDAGMLLETFLDSLRVREERARGGGYGVSFGTRSNTPLMPSRTNGGESGASLAGERGGSARERENGVLSDAPFLSSPVYSGPQQLLDRLSPSGNDTFFFFGASGRDGVVSQHPRMPSDLLTSCLTTPLLTSMLWFMVERPELRELHPILLHLIPGSTTPMTQKVLTDRKTPLGHLQCYFQCLTESIAWSSYPVPLFSRLFLHDVYLRPLVQGYLLAEHIVVGGLAGSISVYPPVPPTYTHPYWNTWESAVERCCVILLKTIRPPPPTRMSTLEFREWLDIRLAEWKYHHTMMRSAGFLPHGGPRGEAAAAGPAGVAGTGGPEDGGVSAAGTQVVSFQALRTVERNSARFPDFLSEEMQSIAATVESLTNQAFDVPPLYKKHLVRQLYLPRRRHRRLRHTSTLPRFFSAHHTKDRWCGEGNGMESAFIPATTSRPPLSRPATERVESFHSSHGQPLSPSLESSRGPPPRPATTTADAGASRCRRSWTYAEATGPRLNKLLMLNEEEKGWELTRKRLPLTSRGNYRLSSRGKLCLERCFVFWIDRFPILLQCLMQNQYRERALGLLCRLVDIDKEVVVQLAGMNLHSVLMRLWGRPELGHLMPSLLFVANKICYLDPGLVGIDDKSKQCLREECFRIMKSPVEFTLRSPGPGSIAGGGSTTSPGAWQLEVLGPFASPEGQQLMASALLSLLMLHDDGFRESCHRQGYFHTTCRLLHAACKDQPELVPSHDIPVVSGSPTMTLSSPNNTNANLRPLGSTTSSRTSFPVAAPYQPPHWHLPTGGSFTVPMNGTSTGGEGSSSPPYNAPNTAEYIHNIQRLTLVGLWFSFLHEWRSDPTADCGNDYQARGTGEDGPAAPPPLTSHHRSSSGFFPRRGALHESFQMALEALETLSRSVTPLLRGAAMRSLGLLLPRLFIPEEVRRRAAQILLESFYRSTLRASEASWELMTEACLAGHHLVQFLVEQLRDEIDLEDMSEFIRMWIVKLGMDEKKWRCLSPPCLDDEPYEENDAESDDDNRSRDGTAGMSYTNPLGSPSPCRNEFLHRRLGDEKESGRGGEGRSFRLHQFNRGATLLGQGDHGSVERGTEAEPSLGQRSLKLTVNCAFAVDTAEAVISSRGMASSLASSFHQARQQTFTATAASSRYFPRSEVFTPAFSASPRHSSSAAVQPPPRRRVPSVEIGSGPAVHLSPHHNAGSASAASAPRHIGLIYLPVLSNLVRLLVEEAHSSSIAVAHSAQKLLFQDLSFFGLWSDLAKKRELSPGGPPAGGHHTPSFPPRGHGARRRSTSASDGRREDEWSSGERDGLTRSGRGSTSHSNSASLGDLYSRLQGLWNGYQERVESAAAESMRQRSSKHGTRHGRLRHDDDQEVAESEEKEETKSGRRRQGRNADHHSSHHRHCRPDRHPQREHYSTTGSGAESHEKPLDGAGHQTGHRRARIEHSYLSEWSSCSSYSRHRCFSSGARPTTSSLPKDQEPHQHRQRQRTREGKNSHEGRYHRLLSSHGNSVSASTSGSSERSSSTEASIFWEVVEGERCYDAYDDEWYLETWSTSSSTHTSSIQSSVSSVRHRKRRDAPDGPSDEQQGQTRCWSRERARLSVSGEESTPHRHRRRRGHEREGVAAVPSSSDRLLRRARGRSSRSSSSLGRSPEADKGGDHDDSSAEAAQELEDSIPALVYGSLRFLEGMLLLPDDAGDPRTPYNCSRDTAIDRYSTAIGELLAEVYLRTGGYTAHAYGTETTCSSAVPPPQSSIALSSPSSRPPGTTTTTLTSARSALHGDSGMGTPQSSFPPQTLEQHYRLFCSGGTPQPPPDAHAVNPAGVVPRSSGVTLRTVLSHLSMNTVSSSSTGLGLSIVGGDLPTAFPYPPPGADDSATPALHLAHADDGGPPEHRAAVPHGFGGGAGAPPAPQPHGEELAHPASTTSLPSVRSGGVAAGGGGATIVGPHRRFPFGLLASSGGARCRARRRVWPCRHRPSNTNNSVVVGPPPPEKRGEESSRTKGGGEGQRYGSADRDSGGGEERRARLSRSFSSSLLQPRSSAQAGYTTCQGTSVPTLLFHPAEPHLLSCTGEGVLQVWEFNAGWGKGQRHRDLSSRTRRHRCRSRSSSMSSRRAETPALREVSRYHVCGDHTPPRRRKGATVRYFENGCLPNALSARQRYEGEQHRRFGLRGDRRRPTRRRNSSSSHRHGRSRDTARGSGSRSSSCCSRSSESARYVLKTQQPSGVASGAGQLGGGGGHRSQSPLSPLLFDEHHTTAPQTSTTFPVLHASPPVANLLHSSTPSLVSGLHFIDATHRPLLCAVQSSGAVSLFSDYAGRHRTRLLGSFDTLRLEERGGRQYHREEAHTHRQLEGGAGFPFHCLSDYSAPGMRLLVTTPDHTVSAWDMSNLYLHTAGIGASCYPNGPHSRVPTVVRAHPTDPSLVAVAADVARVFDLRSRQALPSLVFAPPSPAVESSSSGLGSYPMLSFDFSRRFDHLVLGGYSGPSAPVVVWDDRRPGVPLQVFPTLASSRSRVRSPAAQRVEVHPLRRSLLTLTVTSNALHWTMGPYLGGPATTSGSFYASSRHYRQPSQPQLHSNIGGHPFSAGGTTSSSVAIGEEEDSVWLAGSFGASSGMTDPQPPSQTTATGNPLGATQHASFRIASPPTTTTTYATEELPYEITSACFHPFQDLVGVGVRGAVLIYGQGGR